MKTKRNLLALVIIMASSAFTQAQSYSNAVGLRLGSSNGISFKHFMSEADAVEIIANTRWRGLQITALYERHQGLEISNQLKFYYGAGGHLGVWDNYDNHPWFDDKNNKQYVVVGIDGILGLEYIFKEVPIALSLDWKPEFNLVGYSGIWLGDSGLSVRYYW